MSEEQAVYIWAHDSDKVPELTCQQEIYGLVTGGGQQGSSTSSMLSGYKKDIQFETKRVSNELQSSNKQNCNAKVTVTS